MPGEFERFWSIGLQFEPAMSSQPTSFVSLDDIFLYPHFLLIPFKLLMEHYYLP
jgi:hypothetical protein